MRMLIDWIKTVCDRELICRLKKATLKVVGLVMDVGRLTLRSWWDEIIVRRQNYGIKPKNVLHVDRKNIEKYANNISSDIVDDNQWRKCKDAGPLGP